MNRTFINFITDALAALAMVGMIATGIILRFALPPGTSRSLALWGLTRHQWGDLHFWLALAALGVVLIHIVLHWTWVVSVVRRWLIGGEQVTPSGRVRALAAAATATVLALSLAGFWKWSLASVRQLEAPPPIGHAAGAGGEQLRGNMTLVEAAAALGCSAQELRARLALPSDSPETDRLGQIARNMGIDMQELRRRLEAGAGVAP